MNISKKIREIREEKGLKQYEIADKLGVERANYSYLEKRGKKLSIEQLEQIAEALGVTVKEILFSEKSTESEKEVQYLAREFAHIQKEVELKDKIIEIQKENVEVKELALKTLLINERC